ncbi:MAG: 6-phosphogluconolactonase [Planctomycetota bacterium]
MTDGANRSVEVVRDAETLAARAAGILDAWVGEDQAGGGTCRIALAGGTSPLGAYRIWSRSYSIDPKRLEVFFGDERCVPADDAESNFRAASEALLEPMGVPEEHVHRMHGDHADRDAAARDYEHVLPRELDVLVLGLGPDGHTASLFPGDRAALLENERSVLHVVGPKPPPDRLTITPPVIDRARRVLVLASGASKAEAVAAALGEQGDVMVCPVRLARSRAWLVDTAASARLDRRLLDG